METKWSEWQPSLERRVATLLAGENFLLLPRVRGGEQFYIDRMLFISDTAIVTPSYAGIRLNTNFILLFGTNSLGSVVGVVDNPGITVLENQQIGVRITNAVGGEVLEMGIWLWSRKREYHVG